ncbi:MAG: SDR family oxidoreductase [Rubripirellula sp.]|nr:SDR family oxidoreductase [Rubripirellula sp.]
MSDKFCSNSQMRGTHVVVTGASSGIGRATAIEMAMQGARHLLIHYCSNEVGAAETAEEVERFGATVTICQADLSLQEDRQNLVEAAFGQLSEVNAWVNNAGVDVLTGEIANQGFDSKLQRLLSVDLVGTISLSRLVVARWLEEQAVDAIPAMTFIGWDQADQGMEGDAGQMFGPVKAAVMAYAKNLAQSVAPCVRVNAVAPGWIKTAWGTEVTGYWSDRAIAQSLMGRWGTAQDVARAICYLSSPANHFITGQVLEVNGGWNRRFDQPKS